jgi:hypothetical protein
MSLQGTLADFSVADLFQLLGLGQRTGCLKLEHETEQGEVYFKEGYIVAAKGSRQEAEDAVYHFFSWSTGRFVFENDKSPLRENMMIDWQNLILEAARRNDELSEVKKTIPDGNAILTLIDEGQSNIDAIKLNNDDLKVLSLINGKRTVDEVIAKSSMDNVEASKTLASLIKANLIDIRMTQEEHQRRLEEKLKKSGVDVEKNISMLTSIFKRKRKRKYEIVNSAAGLLIDAINRYLDVLLLDTPIIAVPIKEITDKFEELKMIYPDMEGVVYSNVTERFNSDQLDWDETTETPETVLRGLAEILEYIFELARQEAGEGPAVEKFREVRDDVVKDASKMDRPREAVLGTRFLPKK